MVKLQELEKLEIVLGSTVQIGDGRLDVKKCVQAGWKKLTGMRD